MDGWPEDWWQQAARDARTLIEQLGERRAVLVGTSGGAVAALWGAILCPELVRAVIADSLTERMPPEALRREVRARMQKTPEQVGFWRLRTAQIGRRWLRPTTAFSWRLPIGRRLVRRAVKAITCPVLLSASLADDLLPDPAANPGYGGADCGERGVPGQRRRTSFDVVVAPRLSMLRRRVFGPQRINAMDV